MAIIFNIQKFSIQDGPGVRTTVFIKGCPLRCPWCSNPESQSILPEVAHLNSLCNKCKRCAEVCGVQAITVNDEGININRNLCNHCGKCAEVCIPGAIKIYGKEMSLTDVFQDVERDKPFYDNSGGGVTASGGEPLSQSFFVTDLFRKCQDAGIHTCLETSGYAESDDLERVMRYTNLILYDIKLLNKDTHQEIIGKSNDRILNNLELIVRSRTPLIIRIPIIPGINGSEENIKDIAYYIKNLNGIEEVNLLPYHRLGESKYAMLDRKYNLCDLLPPDSNQLEKLRIIFESLNLNCEIVQ